jgi:hypothetical protein
MECFDLLCLVVTSSPTRLRRVADGMTFTGCHPEQLIVQRTINSLLKSKNKSKNFPNK